MNYDPPGQRTLPMEGYFSDLYNGDGVYHNWDANGDGNFGDFIDEFSPIDLLSDVFTSRIPVSTPEELQAALNNAIAYETLTRPDDDWFNRVLFAADSCFTGVHAGELRNGHKLPFGKIGSIPSRSSQDIPWFPPCENRQPP